MSDLRCRVMRRSLYLIHSMTRWRAAAFTAASTLGVLCSCACTQSSAASSSVRCSASGVLAGLMRHVNSGLEAM